MFVYTLMINLIISITDADNYLKHILVHGIPVLNLPTISD